MKQALYIEVTEAAESAENSATENTDETEDDSANKEAEEPDTFTYGDKNQLISYTDPEGRTENYTYDINSNLTKTVDKNGNTHKNTYDGESKLTSVTDEDGEEVVGYAYDTDGNLSERTVAGNGMTTSYVYDYQKRLTTLKNSNGSGVISEYTSEYLANGQKSKKISKVQNKDGKTEEKTVFVWDGDQLVMELSEGGKVKKRYIRGNDLVFADKGNSSEKTFYVTDTHGNVVQLTDDSGKVTKTYEYDSFGNEVKPEKKDENPFRYCGEYYDKETEEVYLRARYYQPAVGRFLTRDSYTGESDEPESLHLYTYCENDGVNCVDPSGHDAIWLQYKHGAAEQGHTVLLIQNRKLKWFYFYWGAQSGVIEKVLGPYDKIVKLANVKIKRNLYALKVILIKV